MTMENVLLEIEDRIATVTLNRPDALNATTDGLYGELAALWPKLRSDPDVACVILTGAGRGFCAGADLKNRRTDLTPLQLSARHRWILTNVLRPLYEMEKPVIAAVNGPAAGAGANIALACDFAYASEKASFTQAFARVGLIPDLGGLFFLQRAVGRARAKELAFTARKVEAAEALELGLVQKVVPHDELLAAARETALAIAQNAPTSIGMMKTLIDKSEYSTFDQMVEFEAYAQTAAFVSPDYLEGVNAFREKRKPVFNGGPAQTDNETWR
ncbi:enoyl-CoA hydratase [Altererythrobacter indicus]|uniref:Enoyl-CoA hydratase n=1 Tax=Altericroceibacterium indicum TaxID=374177 RepID=A0A845A377_9SPHN|nr:enoyl-CoA hydratase-related protein [Altericroceibacterium indicum]MXP24682.1 enoyl-CoA hydratase [Altericroceibacterium indicum]